MNRLSAGILSFATLAGLGGSTVAYAWASAGSGAPAPARPVVHDRARPSVPHMPRTTPVRWAPCVPPARLEQGVCVTEVVRTVVVPAPASPSAPEVPTAPGTPATRTGTPAVPTPQAREDGVGERGDDRAGDDHHEGQDEGAARAVAPRTR